ncbi:MAG: hypothetical protein ACYTG2_10530 [Planctomycetota bacterium]|jgi:hypothetical protein
MPDRSTEDLPIAPWFIVWCGWIAASVFVPEHLVRRFVAEPMLAEFLRQFPRDPEDLDQFLAVQVINLRCFAVGFALLYILVRALTVRLRRDGNAGVW